MIDVRATPGAAPTKMYLGDGVYAEWDGYNIDLATDAQWFTTRIVLEPVVLKALFEFALSTGHYDFLKPGDNQ